MIPRPWLSPGHIGHEDLGEGASRVELLGAFASAGVNRVMTMARASATTDEALESLATSIRRGPPPQRARLKAPAVSSPYP